MLSFSENVWSIRMPYSQSYPVTVQVNLPQPHVSYTSKTPNMFCSGWCPFVAAGVFAIVLMVCIHVFGGQKIFLQVVDPTAGLVPIIKQGSLKIYPELPGYVDGIESHYFTHLPPYNLSLTTKSLDDLFKTYPETHERLHKNCWLENPTPENPCFFDSSWVSEVCSRENSYGYQESDDHYSPCFVMRLEKTGDWMPRLTRNIPQDISDHYDPGFIPVHCFVKTTNGSDVTPNLTVYPPKGFSHLFFPVSKFDPKRYLQPLVAVKLNRIPKAENITVECSVITPNAFLLWNNGRAVIRFRAM